MASLIFPFSGRISRRAWWLYQVLIGVFFLIGLILFALVAVLRGTPVEQNSLFGYSSIIILLVVTTYMNFCACVNRMQDTGRSAWWWLTFSLPFCGTGLMVYFCGIEKGGSVHRPLNIEKDLELLRDMKEHDRAMSSPGARYQPSPTHQYANPTTRRVSNRQPRALSPNGKPTFGRRGHA